jgi:uncharacterized protein YjbJ (UPF0337 family)
MTPFVATNGEIQTSVWSHLRRLRSPARRGLRTGTRGYVASSTPTDIKGDRVQLGRIDTNKVRGVIGKALGLGKESFGVLIGNDRLEREGEAQQERAAAELKSFREQLRAQKADVKAGAMEKRERAAQRAKAAG